MAGEEAVRDVLCLGSTAGIHEIGVFPPPATELDTRPGVPEVGAALRQGHGRRLAADPRVLILEDIPEPALIKGPVISLRRRRWVIDTRSEEPAVLVIHTAEGTRLVVWGARGVVRLFSVDDGKP